jgi:hypothetical protein
MGMSEATQNSQRSKSDSKNDFNILQQVVVHYLRPTPIGIVKI